MTILISPYRHRFGADTALGTLLGDEPAGVAVDFTTMRLLIRDDTKVPAPTPELITNGTFNTNITGWTAGGANAPTLTWVNGALRITNNSGNGYAYQTISTVIGKAYRISGLIVGFSGITLPNCRLYIGTTVGAFDVLNYSPTPGPNAETFIATTITTYITLQIGVVGSIDWDNVSVKGMGSYIGPIAPHLTGSIINKYLFNGFGDLKSVPALSCDHDPLTLDTSVTTISTGLDFIGDGTPERKTWITTGAYSYLVDQTVRLTDANNILSWLLGRVVSFSGTTLVVDVYAKSGDFSCSDWRIIAALGLLTEPVRTNIALQSERFDLSNTTLDNATITTAAIIAPDGAMTGNKIVETAVSGVHGPTQAFTPAVTQAVTMSVYAKAGERTQLWLGATGGLATIWTGSVIPSAVFDLVIGIIVSQTAGTTCSIQKLKNGWFRCSVGAIVVTSSATAMAVRPALGGTDSYLGEVNKGIYVWGRQNESQGTAGWNAAFTTSYLPTTTVAVPRSSITSEYYILRMNNANVPQPTDARGTITWRGFSADIDTNTGTGATTGRVMSVGVSQDTGNLNHIAGLVKSDSSTRISRNNATFRNEAGTIKFIETVANNTFPTTPPGKTIGMTWNTAESIVVSGFALTSTIVDTNWTITPPARFKIIDWNGFGINIYHQQSVYLPRKLTVAELERRCSVPPFAGLLREELVERIVDIVDDERPAIRPTLPIGV